MIKCSNCGEHINEGFKFCPECGVVVNFKFKMQNNKQEKNSKNKRSTPKDRSQKINTQIDIPKKISSTKLYYLIFLLLLLGFVLIYSSGIFDKTVTLTSDQIGNSSNPHSGVDLSNLEQINTLEEKVKKDPKDIQLLLSLAHLLNDSGFKEKAIDKYKEYLKFDDKNADVLVDMGVCFFETGNNSEAINSMEKALKIQPRHQIAHLNLGIVNKAVGNSLKAIEWWKKAVEIDPNNEIGKKAQELIKTN